MAGKGSGSSTLPTARFCAASHGRRYWPRLVALTLIVGFAGAVVLARLPLPWRSIAGTVVLAVALFGNIGLLIERHDRFLSMIECERSMTPVARGSAGNPC